MKASVPLLSSTILSSSIPQLQFHTSELNPLENDSPVFICLILIHQSSPPPPPNTVLVVPVPELGLPSKRIGGVHLLGNEFRHDISRVNIDGTNGHNLLTFLPRKLTEQQRNQAVQLLHLLFIIIPQCVLVPLFKLRERRIDLNRPPNLSACQSHLSTVRARMGRAKISF